MKKLVIAAAIAAAASIASSAAIAGAADYNFEPVSSEIKKGDDVIVALRLTHKPSGKPVADAVIVRTRVDMGPDGMADMVSPVALVPGGKPGVYALKTDLPMAGRYLVSIAAKVQGETETVIGKVIVKAVK
jgi:YtkA-like